MRARGVVAAVLGALLLAATPGCMTVSCVAEYSTKEKARTEGPVTVSGFERIYLGGDPGHANLEACVSYSSGRTTVVELGAVDPSRYGRTKHGDRGSIVFVDEEPRLEVGGRPVRSFDAGGLTLGAPPQRAQLTEDEARNEWIVSLDRATGRITVSMPPTGGRSVMNGVASLDGDTRMTGSVPLPVAPAPKRDDDPPTLMFLPFWILVDVLTLPIQVIVIPVVVIFGGGC